MMLRLAYTFILAVLLTKTASAQDQDPALERLNNSPRHHEWASISQGDRTVEAFVVYPEISEKAHAVLVIH